MKFLKTGLVGCVLALVLSFPMGAQAQTSSSPNWKNCGLFHYQAKRYVRTEALRVGCTEVKRIARLVALHTSSKFCPDAGECIVSGFTCPINPGSNRIVCVRADERIRMRGVIKRG
jgi:hypothetical protein